MTQFIVRNCKENYVLGVTGIHCASGRRDEMVLAAADDEEMEDIQRLGSFRWKIEDIAGEDGDVHILNCHLEGPMFLSQQALNTVGDHVVKCSHYMKDSDPAERDVRDKWRWRLRPVGNGAWCIANVFMDGALFVSDSTWHSYRRVGWSPIDKEHEKNTGKWRFHIVESIPVTLFVQALQDQREFESYVHLIECNGEAEGTVRMTQEELKKLDMEIGGIRSMEISGMSGHVLGAFAVRQTKGNLQILRRYLARHLAISEGDCFMYTFNGALLCGHTIPDAPL